ncbi:MAG TPA: hypothetical protein VNN08_15990 [Thermoanaerobaculia bacterium]|nr:hypothetical protein [Thermoanaerobaculia bacterium]
MKTTIDLLKDALDDSRMNIDESALFELLDTTLCSMCCDSGTTGGNKGCQPD